jgi:hypothetical protein
MPVEDALPPIKLNHTTLAFVCNVEFQAWLLKDSCNIEFFLVPHIRCSIISRTIFIEFFFQISDFLASSKILVFSFELQDWWRCLLNQFSSCEDPFNKTENEAKKFKINAPKVASL